jgi:tight adherence protein C
MTLVTLWPLVCVGLLALGVFQFVESLPLGAPRPRLADRLRELDPEHWARVAQSESAALRPVRVGSSILRPFVEEAGSLLQRLLGRLGIGSGDDLRETLALIRPGVEPAQHYGEKLVIAVIGVGFFPTIEAFGIRPFGPAPLWLWVSLGLVGFAAPDWYLTRKRAQRQTRVLMELPTILSMLAIALAAGHSIEEAVARVADASDGEVARELQRVRRELRLGQRYLVPALAEMARRNRIPELDAVVGHIRAANDLGLSLTATLRTEAAALRDRKRLRIVEEGGKGSIRMVLPVALFILPVLFVILLAPAAATVASWGD